MRSRREPGRLGGAGSVVDRAGILGALAIGVGGLRETIEQHPSPPETDADAAVIGLWESGGLSVLGVTLQSPTYRVRVRLLASEACLSHLDGGVQWPVALDDCRSDVPIAGIFAGAGRVATGETIVAVEREIARECYEALRASPGEPWPRRSEACATE